MTNTKENNKEIESNGDGWEDIFQSNTIEDYELATEDTYLDAYKTQEDNENQQIIAFWQEDEEYALDLLEVKEILRFTPPTFVPRTKPFVLGVISVRGEVLPVIDLMCRMNLGTSSIRRGATISSQDRGRRGARTGRREEGEYIDVFNRRATPPVGMDRRPNPEVIVAPRLKETTRILVVEKDGDRYGLTVDSISGVYEISPKSIEPPPPAMKGQDNDFLSGIGRIGTRMLILIQLAAVLSFDAALASEAT